MTTLEKRVKRLEEAYPNLATREDVANLGNVLGKRIDGLESFTCRGKGRREGHQGNPDPRRYSGLITNPSVADQPFLPMLVYLGAYGSRATLTASM